MMLDENPPQELSGDCLVNGSFSIILNQLKIYLNVFSGVAATSFQSVLNPQMSSLHAVFFLAVSEQAPLVFLKFLLQMPF